MFDEEINNKFLLMEKEYDNLIKDLKMKILKVIKKQQKKLQTE